MLLKQLYLYLNLIEYPASVQGPFGFRTRYLCNYVERELRALKFNADGFSRICIEGRAAFHDPTAIGGENAVIVPVAFDGARYASLSSVELHEFFIDMLLRGLEKCARERSIPQAELVRAVERFREVGYVNEWIHQHRRFPSVGIEATLRRSLEMESFRLRLTLVRNGVAIFDQTILETKPDETIFEHRFKDVLLENGTILVNARRSNKPVLFQVDLASLPA